MSNVVVMQAWSARVRTCQNHIFSGRSTLILKHPAGTLSGLYTSQQHLAKLPGEHCLVNRPSSFGRLWAHENCAPCVPESPVLEQ